MLEDDSWIFDSEAASGKWMELFEDNSKEIEGEHLVSEEGLTKMSTLFECVPLEVRADVFISFLDMLHEEGYAFNMEQFSGVSNEPDPEEDVLAYENEGGMYN